MLPPDLSRRIRALIGPDLDAVVAGSDDPTAAIDALLEALNGANVETKKHCAIAIADEKRLATLAADAARSGDTQTAARLEEERVVQHHIVKGIKVVLGELAARIKSVQVRRISEGLPPHHPNAFVDSGRIIERTYSASETMELVESRVRAMEQAQEGSPEARLEALKKMMGLTAKSAPPPEPPLAHEALRSGNTFDLELGNVFERLPHDDPALATAAVLELGPHVMPVLCMELPPSIIRAVLAHEQARTRAHLAFVREVVGDAENGSVLAERWERALRALMSLLHVSDEDESAREHGLASMEHETLLRGVQAACAGCKEVPFEMLVVLAQEGSDASLDAFLPHFDRAMSEGGARRDRLWRLRSVAPVGTRFAEILAGVPEPAKPTPEREATPPRPPLSAPRVAFGEGFAAAWEFSEPRPEPASSAGPPPQPETKPAPVPWPKLPPMPEPPAPPPPPEPKTWMGNQAKAALLRYEGPPVMVRRERAAAAYFEARNALRGAEQRVGWWDRMNVLSDSKEERRAQQLAARTEQHRLIYEAARAESDRVMGAAREVFTPLAVVYDIESVIRAVLDDLEVGVSAVASRRIALSLDTIADDILTIWAPGVDVGEVARRLTDDAARRQAHHGRIDEPARDLVRGWAPVSGDEIFARVAAALERDADLAAAQMAVARERRESAAVAVELRQAATSGAVDDAEVERLRAAFAREEHESAWAEEWVRLTVARAFGVHPVFWVHHALRAAAAAARAAQPGKETKRGLYGGTEVTSLHARAVVLACLVEVRRACAVAFPEVREQLWLLDAPKPTRARGMGHGPYRAAPARVSAGNSPPSDHGAATSSAAIGSALVGRGVDQQLALAVSAASMLGVLERNIPDVNAEVAPEHASPPAWIDRLAFWSPNQRESPTESVPARVAHYRSLVNAYSWSCLSRIETLAAGDGVVGLSRTLTSLDRAVGAITTDTEATSMARSCRVHNREEALAAVANVRSCLSRAFGVRGSGEQLIADVLAQVTAATGLIEDVPNLAALPHSQVVRRLARHVQRHLLAASETGQAAAPWESANPLEREAHRFSQALASGDARAKRVWQEALESYPVLSLQPRLDAVERALHGIVAESEASTRSEKRRNAKGRVTHTRTEKVYRCRLEGHQAATTAVLRLRSGADHVFGELPCAGDVVERWVREQL